jgi:hypothetical protein
VLLGWDSSPSDTHGASQDEASSTLIPGRESGRWQGGSRESEVAVGPRRCGFPIRNVVTGPGCAYPRGACSGHTPQATLMNPAVGEGGLP